jgi:integrase
MRGCEIKGLQWKSVDVNCRFPVFRIRRSTTKTDAGERVVPIHPTPLALLQEAHTTAKAIGMGEPDHYVFPACERGCIDPNKPIKTLRSAWRSLTRAAGLKGLRFHDLRHLAVTELAERGTGEQTIMSISGHINRKMLEHYSHPRLEAQSGRPSRASTCRCRGSSPRPERGQTDLQRSFTAQSTAQKLASAENCSGR